MGLIPAGRQCGTEGRFPAGGKATTGSGAPKIPSKGIRARSARAITRWWRATLGEIATRSGAWQQLRMANNLSGDLIRVGQELKIPGKGQASGTEAPSLPVQPVSSEDVSGDEVGEVAGEGLPTQRSLPAQPVQPARTEVGQRPTTELSVRNWSRMLRGAGGMLRVRARRCA